MPRLSHEALEELFEACDYLYGVISSRPDQSMALAEFHELAASTLASEDSDLVLSEMLANLLVTLDGDRVRVLVP